MIYITGDTHGDYSRFNDEAFPVQSSLTKDDYVIIRTAGAYGESMASRYNFRELPIGYLDFEL